MNTDLELELWRRHWQAEMQVPIELRKRVERETRRIRILLWVDVAVTVIIGPAVTLWAVNSHRWPVTVLAIWSWLLIVVAWLFKATNDPGNWSGKAPDTEAFLELSRRRCRASLRALAFSCVLYILQVSFCLAWVYREVNQSSPVTIRQFLALTPSIAVWVVSAVLFFAAIWYWRRKRDELAYLTSLQKDLRDFEEAGQLALSQNPGRLAVLESVSRAVMRCLSEFEGIDERLRWKKKMKV